jgi:hypothetical protein
MTRKLHIIASCTLSKSQRPVFRLGANAGEAWQPAAKRWHAQLDSPGRTTSARALYKGLHWQLILGCESIAAAAGIKTDLWVISAGRGFMHVNDPVISYSATFAPQSPDSIHGLNWPDQYASKERSRRWWDRLSRLFGQHSGRQLTALAEDPGDLVVFVIPRDYYGAIEHEILALRAKGVNTVVACAGLNRVLATVHPGLRDVILPLGDRSKQLDPSLDLPNTTLNAAFCAWLLREHRDSLFGPTATFFAELQADYDRLLPLAKRPPVSLSDPEILTYIEKHYEPSNSSATRLLRRLRKEGRSCEQFRFGRLYKQFLKNHFGLRELFNGA